MSMLPLASAAPSSASPPSSEGLLAQELADLMREIQRTQEWFNSQIDSQLNRLSLLRSSLQGGRPLGASSASVLEAPPRCVHASPGPEPTPMALKSAPAHQAIILPPAPVATLDPVLEQATLRELNDALSQAFAEISARGGMLT